MQVCPWMVWCGHGLCLHCGCASIKRGHRVGKKGQRCVLVCKCIGKYQLHWTGESEIFFSWRMPAFANLTETVLDNTIQNILVEASRGEVVLTSRPKIIALPRTISHKWVDESMASVHKGNVPRLKLVLWIWLGLTKEEVALMLIYQKWKLFRCVLNGAYSQESRYSGTSHNKHFT